jgi:hypothetical protein
LSSQSCDLTKFENHTDSNREDDKVWPKKNIVGRQELEVRIGSDHISFEVSCCDLSSDKRHDIANTLDRKNWKSGRCERE